MLTAPQLRAARGLVKWSQNRLAEEAGVSEETVKRIERFEGEISALGATLEAIQKALEGAGVVFLPENGNGPGVALRKD